jgi:hypothetical protein
MEQPDEVPARKAGGHGDHWGCIYREVQKDDLFNFIRRNVEEDSSPDIASQGVSAYCSGGDGLRVCVLIKDGQLESAYPEVHGGPVWPVTITEVVPWANGVEGQVTGTCNSATVSFFDTRFYANQRLYTVGETYNFHMGALAYKVNLAEEMEAESGTGDSATKVSFRGARAYMPAVLSSESADIDDFWFYSPVEAPTSEFEFDGRPLRVLPITMALPNDFEMSVSLYAAEHTSGPGMEGVAQGDDLTGFLWLQGYLET